MESVAYHGEVWGDVAPASYIPPRTEVVRKGTSIQIAVGGALPPFLEFSLSGGSNWHVAAISGTGGASCSLTRSDGGGACAFAVPAFGFVLNATFTGGPPTFVDGQITYAHDVAMRWSFPGPGGGAGIGNAAFTGLNDRKPGLRFAFKYFGDGRFLTKLQSFDIRLPRGDGLSFDPGSVMKGAACHGPGKWKSSWVNAREMGCTPRVPYPWEKPSLTPVVTKLRSSAIKETVALEQKVKEHKVAKLLFYITAHVPRGDLAFRAVAPISGQKGAPQ